MVLVGIAFILRIEAFHEHFMSYDNERIDTV